MSAGGDNTPDVILEHPNTIMMITHGGFLSYMEAMYYGVPIIGIPVQEDQLLTVDIAASRGRAMKVSLSSAGMGYKLNEAIFEILGNYRYVIKQMYFEVTVQYLIKYKKTPLVIKVLYPSKYI